MSNFPSPFTSNAIFDSIIEVGFVLVLNSCGFTLHKFHFHKYYLLSM